MYDIKIARAVCAEEVLDGLCVIADAAAAVYGTENAILCAGQEKEAFCGSQMGEVLQNGLFENGYAELVRAALADGGVLPDGMKSAVILAAEYLTIAVENGMDKADFLADIQELTDVAIQELSAIIRANGELLPGCGLFLMNILRRLVRHFEDTGLGKSGKAEKLLYALQKPLLVLAENAGRQPHEVFARITAAAPTQFYSLRQFGMANNIPVTEHRDIWTFGIDVKTGKIVDVMEKGIVVESKTAIDILNKAKEICNTLCAIGCVL
jgi:hypothetical protein